VLGNEFSDHQNGGEKTTLLAPSQITDLRARPPSDRGRGFSGRARTDRIFAKWKINLVGVLATGETEMSTLLASLESITISNTRPTAGPATPTVHFFGGRRLSSGRRRVSDGDVMEIELARVWAGLCGIQSNRGWPAERVSVPGLLIVKRDFLLREGGIKPFAGDDVLSRPCMPFQRPMDGVAGGENGYVL